MNTPEYGTREFYKAAFSDYLADITTDDPQLLTALSVVSLMHCKTGVIFIYRLAQNSIVPLH